MENRCGSISETNKRVTIVAYAFASTRGGLSMDIYAQNAPEMHAIRMCLFMLIHNLRIPIIPIR